MTDGAGRRTAQWDVRNAAPNFIALAASQGASLLFAALTPALAIRILGVERFGEMVGAVAAVQTVHLLGLHWTGLSMLKLGCEEFLQTGAIARTFWARLLLLGGNFALVAASAPLWLPLLSRSLLVPAGMGGLVLASVLLTALAAHGSFALQAVKLPRENSLVVLAEKAVVALGMLAAVGLGLRLGVPEVFSLYLIGQTVVVLASARLLLPWVARGRAAFDLTRCRQVLEFSWPLLPVAAFGYLTTSALDILFIARFLGRGEVAHYSAAYQLTSALVQAPALAGALVLPFLLSAEREDDRALAARYLDDALPLASLGWSLACAAAFFVLRPVFYAITGASPEASTRFLWPMLAASASTAPVLLAYGPLTNARGQTHISARAAVTMAAANIALNLALIPRWGLLGCAWASAIASYMTTCLWMRSTAGFFPDPAAARLSFLLSLPALAAAAASLACSEGSAWPLLAAGGAAVPFFPRIREKTRPTIALILEAGTFHRPASGK